MIHCWPAGHFTIVQPNTRSRTSIGQRSGSESSASFVCTAGRRTPEADARDQCVPGRFNRIDKAQSSGQKGQTSQSSVSRGSWSRRLNAGREVTVGVPQPAAHRQRTARSRPAHRAELASAPRGVGCHLPSSPRQVEWLAPRVTPRSTQSRAPDAPGSNPGRGTAHLPEG